MKKHREKAGFFFCWRTNIDFRCHPCRLPFRESRLNLFLNNHLRLTVFCGNRAITTRARSIAGIPLGRVEGS